MNLAQLRTRLSSFDGFDLEAEEARDLINESRRRFALRSKYPKKTSAFDTTVSGQSTYDWPTDLLLPLKLSVAGLPWEATDEETAARYANGELILQREGAWYDAPGETGARQLHLYPTPGSSSLAIHLEWVYRPTDLVNDTDEPEEIPVEFHPAILFEVAATYYETFEDNPELAQRNSEKADTAVGELTRYDNMRRSGTGIFQVGIVGVTG